MTRPLQMTCGASWVSAQLGYTPPPSASTYSYSYSCEPMGDASAEPEHLCAQPAPRAQQR